MSKRHSSIRAKGAEILFDTSPAVEIGPRSPVVATIQTGTEELEVSIPGPVAEPQPWVAGGALAEPVPEPDPSIIDPDVEKALYEEARGADPNLAGVGGDLLDMDPAPPLTTEMESALIEEALGVAEPRTATDELAIPVMEANMGARDLFAQVAYRQPPPPETYDVVGGVIPPRPTRTPPDPEELEFMAADIQAPSGEVEPFGLPIRPVTEAQRTEMLNRVGEARMRELSSEIEQAYARVKTEVGQNGEIATWCFNLLLKAQDIVLHQDVSSLAQAEYYLEQVRTRLKRAADSSSAARKYGWLFTAWGFLWGAVYMTLLVLLGLGWFDRWLAMASARQAAVQPEVFLQAVLWGGIGGVVAVWYSLFKHVSLRDFDTQYSLSYVGKPFFGLILGGTVYMLVQLLILSLGIWPAGLQDGTGALSGPTIAPWIVYLLAWLCGFNENRIFGLVDRVVKRVFTGEAA